MIVGKAVKMAQMMNVPILGIVENMSYVQCPDCGRRINVFGDSHVDESARNTASRCWQSCPSTRAWPNAADGGAIETYEHEALAGAADAVQALLG